MNTDHLLEPVGRLGARGVVLAFLRDAQPNGVDQRTISEEGCIEKVPQHVASLIAEGHIITSLIQVDPESGGPREPRYYLLKDAWAGLPVAVEG